MWRSAHRRVYSGLQYGHIPYTSFSSPKSDTSKTTLEAQTLGLYTRVGPLISVHPRFLNRDG